MAAGGGQDNRLRSGALIAMAVLGIALCAWIAMPFVPALTWALALAVVAMPAHEWIEDRVSRPSVAAGISVLSVTLLLLIPTMLIAWQVGRQASERIDQMQEYIESGKVRDLAARVPGGERIYQMAFPDHSAASAIVPTVQQQAGTWIRSAISIVFQTVVTAFALFFLLRDRHAILMKVRTYLPMSSSEASTLLDRIRLMTHATIYGNVVTALVQGTLGGIMFAVIGISGALFWGVVMALLSLIPSAGSFLIWLPTAVVLAASGDWVRAGILAGWGTLVVGTIDNVLYPWLVGHEVRLHTLVVFLALVGGLLAFGAPGLVLGPVIAAATVTLLDMLKTRGAAETNARNGRRIAAAGG